MAEPKKAKRVEPDDGADKSNPRGGFPFFVLLMIFGLLALGGYQLMLTGNRSAVDYGFFLQEVQSGNVKDVAINSLTIQGKWENLKVAQEAWLKYKATKEAPPADDAAEKKPAAAPKAELTELFTTDVPALEGEYPLRLMEKHGVHISSVNDNFSVMLLQSFIYLLPVILISVFLLFAMRRSADPMSSGMFGNFVRSQAKRFRPNDLQTTFKDVAGMEHAKRELEEVVDFLKDPAKFQRLGAEIPKGVLLAGPPGTGKTLLARAVAGEAGVPFFSINGSEFIQMFVGVGASRVRDMFRTAKENSPCILFIDEIDAVGRVRGAGVGGGHDEREQTLNQILSEMDGFQANEAVIVVAATNRPDVLDPALLRPGRFDRHVSVDRPSRLGRVGILKVHVRKVPLGENVNLEDIAGSTIGFSGADLKNLVNEAALAAARDGKSQVDRIDFETARDKIMMGVAREEVLNAKERRMTAYHEAGHALLAWLLPEVDTVHKVTIVPRGRALGVTQLLPEEERFHMGESRLRSQLAMMLGGRAAEKLVFDEFSAGAEDDLKRASQIARRMVSAWGMSERIGPVAYRDGEEHPFLGKEIQETRKYSEQTAFLIDQEMQKILIHASERATSILEDNRENLDRISDALLEREIVSREELIELIGPKRVEADVVASV
ncbi:ATP-dependent zinc metalloprotease FtsH [Planctomicrobium piriforme]|uniref:ATP-dependent zinc metalloprotease FtsH n=1 Tax=Planctomicrobium piriforme TaxID=1576369 RepID=A0A1I3TCP4_9PLAN|nr:ATP-dependent zinc metalloprotease FtsH [Planctomicrobium piriforme]SFJ68904.1 cell division protease FtsH [Planctomicrobium piriforme]